MKRVFAWVVAVVLFCQVGLAAAYADMVPPMPTIPKRPENRQQVRRAGYPAYGIAAGGVAVALIGSLIALWVIRKPNGNGPS
jgi:hypothetical protein